MNIWEEIKSKLDIVDILSEYLPLEPSGANFRCRSPFKQEKTPSFIVSPSKQIWHDFSTGQGGDIFKFLVEYDNLSYKEALHKLAKKAGMEDELNKGQTPQTEEDKQEKEKKLSIKEAGYKYLDWVSKHFHKLLLSELKNGDSVVTKYCRERGLSSEIIEQFQIGYAPPKGEMIKTIEQYKLNKPLFEQVGILKTNDSGYSERFTSRLMIPIQDTNGAVVGFTGRVFPGETYDRPKYLNSSESQWFNKSKIWFGWHLARNQMRMQKRVIIVEGNMDVIRCFGSGLDIAIASQGTSFTENHVDELVNSTDPRMINFLKGLEVYLAFDNDTAGYEAGKKFFIECTKKGILLNKIIVPEKFKDLDEYLSDIGGQVEFNKLENANYLDWLIETNKPKLISTDSKIQKSAIEEIMGLVSHTDKITQEQYTNKISSLTEISTNSLESLIKNTQENSFQKDEKPKSGKATPKDNTIDKLRTNLQSIIAHGELDEESNELLFSLIKPILGITESSMEEYIKNNKASLEIIKEESEHKPNQKMVLASTQQLLDQNIHKILEPEKYMELKQKLAN